MNSTKNEILSTAFTLFLQKGFSEISVNDIITKIGLTKGGFYHHFKSKDDLITKVIDEYICPYYQYPINHLKENTDKNTASNAYEKLKAYYTANPKIIIQDAVTNEKKEVNLRDFQFLVFEGMKKYTYLAKLRCSFFKEKQNLLKATIEQGKNEGLIRSDINAASWADTMDILKNGIYTLHLLDEEIDIEEKLLISFNQIWEKIKINIEEA